MSSLTAWENFYVIVGSSAGALTGLLFVAVTLVAQLQMRGSSRGIDAFSTPTVVQFGAVLLISAMLSAPWPSLLPAALLLGLGGLVGVVYTLIVVRRQHRLDSYTRYTPVPEDWLWYAVLPLVAYTALLPAALLLLSSPDLALFAIGGVMGLLLFIGIRNAWDIVTWVAVGRFEQQDEGNERKDEGKE